MDGASVVGEGCVGATVEVRGRVVDGVAVVVTGEEMIGGVDVVETEVVDVLEEVAT